MPLRVTISSSFRTLRSYPSLPATVLDGHAGTVPPDEPEQV
jgi:hypothetical protein